MNKSYKQSRMEMCYSMMMNVANQQIIIMYQQFHGFMTDITNHTLVDPFISFLIAGNIEYFSIYYTSLNDYLMNIATVRECELHSNDSELFNSLAVYLFNKLLHGNNDSIIAEGGLDVR